jgi:hypothetical protein
LINLGFTTEGRLAAVLITPSSWGSQRGVIYTPSGSHVHAILGDKYMGTQLSPHIELKMDIHWTDKRSGSTGSRRSV